MQKPRYRLIWIGAAMMAAEPALAATPKHVPGIAASGDLTAGCSRWANGALADYAHAADLALNRDAHGQPLMPALHMAVYLLRQQRWYDASYMMTGFDHPFWVIPGRGEEPLPPIIGQLMTALKQCRMTLGPDYSMHAVFHYDQHPAVAR